MIKHHYWEWPISLYLFLGGLAGGILLLSAIFNTLIPGFAVMYTMPVFLSAVFIAVGLVLLLIDLGQPGVFWRVFNTAKSVIKWGAVFLCIGVICAILFVVAYLDAAWPFFAPLSDLLKPAADGLLLVAGFFGLCVMMYTGIMLSTLKAHAFWATPVLPVLFTISAISTGCAALVLTLGMWPAPFTAETFAVSHEINEILHVVDIILVVTEIIVLLTMVLSFLGAGNVTAQKAARRWVKGSYALPFWFCMVFCGLVLPLIIYCIGWGVATHVVAPILVLCGGCLLRFLVVNTDDRAPIPGEERYMMRCAKPKDEFVTKWTYGENIY